MDCAVSLVSSASEADAAALSFARYRQAHGMICAAALPPSTARVAHELLACANVGDGQVNMTWERLASVTGCENVNAARRHLSRMSAAKLVHYSTNDFVYVTWLAWLDDATNDVGVPEMAKSNDGEDIEVARSRAEPSAPTRQADEVESMLFGEVGVGEGRATRKSRRVTAPKVARGRAAHSHARGFVSLSVDQPSANEDDLANNLTPPRPAIDDDEQARSIALLMDEEVGIDAAMARWLASRCAFDELVRQVMSWKRQLDGGMVHGSGALVHRIKQGYGAQVTDKDRESALYRRHHPKQGRYSYAVEDFYAEQDRRWGRVNRPEEYTDLKLKH